MPSDDKPSSSSNSSRSLVRDLPLLVLVATLLALPALPSSASSPSSLWSPKPTLHAITTTVVYTLGGMGAFVIGGTLILAGEKALRGAMDWLLHGSSSSAGSETGSGADDTTSTRRS
ncbi:BQ5605_C001g00383 [Microbotryum silenes-dioicae]|uniref:BQ5605_C001g00383 protein n=1 Tax=Microbotryum silenes-dioicae TaxID=796604 RepID=A0A2X0M356_9BASI|nr:BQ5605_C001g00383 [Microbotryum silenes-dioicae]